MILTVSIGILLQILYLLPDKYTLFRESWKTEELWRTLVPVPITDR